MPASYLHSVDQTLEAFSRYRHLVAQPENAALLERGLDGYDDLDAVDRTRFRAVVEEYFFAYNALIDRSRRGAYDFVTPERLVRPLGSILSRPGGQQWWADRGSLFPPPSFVARVQEHFPDLARPTV